jgi:hypothetical protein
MMPSRQALSRGQQVLEMALPPGGVLARSQFLAFAASRTLSILPRRESGYGHGLARTLADTDNADSVSAIVSIKSMIFRSYSD